MLATVTIKIGCLAPYNITWELPPGGDPWEPSQSLLANASNPGCPVNMSLSRAPQQGNVTLGANGTYTFTPPSAEWTGARLSARGGVGSACGKARWLRSGQIPGPMAEHHLTAQTVSHQSCQAPPSFARC